MDRDRSREPNREPPRSREPERPREQQREPPRSREPERPHEQHREPPRSREPERPRDLKDKPKPSAFDVAERKRRNSLVFRLIVGLILLVVFVVFVSLNSDSVSVHFIFTETRTPLAWVFLVCALIGGLVAYLLGRVGRRTSRRYIKELERRLEERGGKRD